MALGEQKRSIRTQVIVAMTVIFAGMFFLLYAVFSTSMQSMLVERENENMISQAKLAESVLMSSTNHLPASTRDWSSWDNTYDYVMGNYDGFLEDYLTDYPFQLYRLNMLTILDKDNNVVYEGFYDFNKSEFMEDAPDLSGLYERIGPATQATFKEGEQLDLVDTTQIGLPGFVSYNGVIYYISSYPIIHSDETGPCVGSFMFGRIIDAAEMQYLTENSGMDFSVLTKDDANFTPAEGEELDADGEYVVVDNGEAIAYVSFADSFGEEDLVVALKSPRTLYEQGSAFINTILLAVAGCCAAVLVIVILLLNRIVIKPLGALEKGVNSINLQSSQAELPGKYSNREMSHLAGAVNNMLSRIKADNDLIRQHNDKLYFSANYDELTGLRNRLSIKNMLTEIITQKKDPNLRATVFFVDLDRFKFINDSLGRALGDRFIHAVAQRLEENLGDEAVIGRMSGDEFVLVPNDLREMADEQFFAEKIFSLFSEPFHLKEREIIVSVSIGSASWPVDGHDAERLINNAEVAMYRAKELGKGLYVFYQKEFHLALQKRIGVENRIRHAVSEGCKEFRAFFQPKVSAGTGEIKGCEALMRWMSPEGMISPADFIPPAEETGLIAPMSWWMMRECCRACKVFEENGIKQSVAVNISAQVLVHEDFLPELKKAVEEAGIDIRMLDIEITESTLLNDMEKVNEVLRELHRLGVEISVDDFGTGYSSLSYLNKLAVDRIKIDQSFVAGIGKDAESEAIIRAIMAMAKSLKMIVTAEGVEEKGQYDFLKGLDCDEIQGYYVSRPVPQDEYTAFMEKWREREAE